MIRKIENFNFAKLHTADQETFKAIREWLGYDTKDLILNDDIDDMIDKMSKVLGLTGMTPDENAELTLEPNCKNKYNYYAKKSGNEFTFNLDIKDEKRLLSVVNKTRRCIYEVKDLDKDMPHVDILEYLDRNLENRNTIGRLYDKDLATFLLNNTDYSLEIAISRPIDEKGEGNYHFYREDVICNYLLSLTFPINLDELYPVIARLTGIDEKFIGNYDIISLIEKYNNEIIGKTVIIGGTLDYMPSTSNPVIPESKLDFYNKVEYCTSNDLDPALARELTDLGFADFVWDADQNKPKEM